MSGEDGGAAMDGGGTTLAGKLALLYDALLPKGSVTSQDKHLAKALNDRAIARGQKPLVTSVYLWKLRTGRADNPTQKVIEALAEHFGIKAGYFFDDTQTAAIERDLLALKGMRDLRVRAVAARLAEMPEDSLAAVGDIVERVYRAVQRSKADTTEDGSG